MSARVFVLTIETLTVSAGCIAIQTHIPEIVLLAINVHVLLAGRISRDTRKFLVKL